jgi:hypothetical protein
MKASLDFPTPEVELKYFLTVANILDDEVAGAYNQLLFSSWRPG